MASVCLSPQTQTNTQWPHVFMRFMVLRTGTNLVDSDNLFSKHWRGERLFSVSDILITK